MKIPFTDKPLNRAGLVPFSLSVTWTAYLIVYFKERIFFSNIKDPDTGIPSDH